MRRDPCNACWVACFLLVACGAENAAPIDDRSALSVAEAAIRSEPDLIVDQPTVVGSIRISTETFAPTDCAVIDGDISSAGTHKLLRFSTQTANIGSGDLFVGKPKRNSPNWVYSTCHGHWHFVHYADYRLLDSTGNQVSIGHKASFCIVDTDMYLASASTRPRFTSCDRQGLSAGWADTYYWGLSGQWVEIDNVPAGSYTLELTVNPARVFTETDYSNNTVQVPVTIP